MYKKIGIDINSQSEIEELKMEIIRLTTEYAN